MTIRRGEPWGRPGTLGAGGVVVHSDAAARSAVELARREGRPYPALGLLGGDLCRTLGGTGAEARLHDGSGVVVPIDLGEALLDGRLHLFVAHLVLGASWWRGRRVHVMNAEWLGGADIAPRAHPNDGLLDVIELSAAMGARERFKVRRRLASGTHLPHPGITARRAPAFQFEFDRPVAVTLDGLTVGEARRVSARLEPDALVAVV